MKPSAKITALLTAGGLAAVLSACAASNGPAPDAVSAATAAGAPAPAAGSRAERVLPGGYRPGGEFTVAVRVFPRPGLSGVIIEETLPPGWRVLDAVPPASKQAGHTWTWLTWGREITGFEIVYRVAVPPDAAGQQAISGYLKSMRDGILPVAGDQALAPE